MAGLWLWAGVSIVAIIASLRWTTLHRDRSWRTSAALALALVGVISLGFAIYGMTAFCEAPPGMACA
jgi:hypothetical protein